MSTILTIEERRRRIDPTNEFFLDGNYERYNSFLSTSLMKTERISKEKLANEDLFTCKEVGCNQTFSSLNSFEEHRFKCHQHQCSVCNKSFLSDRLLSIHISELHDSYFEMLAKRRPAYSCLVDGCSDLFWSDKERRSHLQDVHHYHQSYDFHNPKKYLKQYTKQRNSEQSTSCTDTSTSQKQQHALTAVCHSSKVPAELKSDTGQRITGGGGNRAQRRAEKRNNNSNFCSDTAVTKEVSTSNFALTDNNKEPEAAYENPHVNSVTMEMDLEDDLSSITEHLHRTSIHVPSKISFGRRRGHH